MAKKLSLILLIVGMLLSHNAFADLLEQCRQASLHKILHI